MLSMTCAQVYSGILSHYGIILSTSLYLLLSFHLLFKAVQSCSENWTGKGRSRAPRALCDWLRCSCVANDIIILQTVRTFCNFFITKTPADYEIIKASVRDAVLILTLLLLRISVVLCFLWKYEEN